MVEKIRKKLHEQIKPGGGFHIVVPGMEHAHHAAIIANWTANAGNMLPKTPDEILGFFKKGHAVLVFNTVGQLMSHAAATFMYGDGSIELGAVFTAEEHRGKGAATQAVAATIDLLRDKYPDQKIFALANPQSAKLFEKMGAKKIGTGELSSEVWAECHTCPKNPTKFTTDGDVIFHCCDTPYELTHITTHS